MAGYPPGVPPVPPPGWDPRAQRQFYRDQRRAQRDAYRAQRERIRYQWRGMRRASVLGPVLLIAIGVIVLLIHSGHLNHDAFWGWYERWWPLLLVGSGVVVLAEWAIDQHRMSDPQQMPYRRSLGGGVMVLLLFFVFAGAVARHAHEFPDGYSKVFPGWNFDQNSFDEFFGDKHESDQTLDFAFAAGNSLTVVNPRGDVTISGTSDDGRIHIAVHKQVYARSDSDADAKAQQLTPVADNQGNAMKITMPSIDGAHADLVIQVPGSAETTVTANHGDIHISSIKAPVTATANHGDIELSAITGQTTAHINSGSSSVSAHSMEGAIFIQGRADDVTLSDVTGPVSMAGEFFGTTHLEHINGTIHFHTSRTDLQFARLDGESEISGHGISADQVLGPVVLNTSNRNVELERIAGDINVTNRNGEIELTAAPSLGSINLEDRNGSIKATLPQRAAFSVDAGTTDGDVYTDFPLATSGTENTKSLSGTVGAGGPLVRIRTTNSDVSVVKGDVQPLAPTPPSPPKITLEPPKPPAPPAPPHGKKQ